MSFLMTTTLLGLTMTLGKPREYSKELRIRLLINTGIPKMMAYLPTTTSRTRRVPVLLTLAYMQALGHATRPDLEFHGLNQEVEAEAEAEAVVVAVVVED